MLDLQFICENQTLVEENCRNRAVHVDVARLVELARQRSHLIVEGDKHRHEQKEIAAQIPKVSDKEQRQTLIDRGKQLKQLVAENDATLKTLEAQLREFEMQVPNLTHPDAPVGAGDQANRTVRTWGERRTFDFQPRDHVELMERLDLVDLEAARVAGHGFYFLKNEAVLLELGLVQLALEKLRAAGFIRLGAGGAAVSRFFSSWMACLRIWFDLRPLIPTTKPTPHASCSNQGS